MHQPFVNAGLIDDGESAVQSLEHVEVDKPFHRFLQDSPPLIVEAEYVLSSQPDEQMPQA